MRPREEVQRAVELVDALLSTNATWTNKKSEKLTIRLEDILTVAPYNAQVSALVGRLPAGTRVKRSLIQERVRAGLRNAKLKGKTLGRPSLILDSGRIARLRAAGASIREIQRNLKSRLDDP